MEPRSEKFLQAALITLALAIAWIAIPEGADMLTDLSNHMRRLFQRARLFNADFFQLILIAAFVGWGINRFRKGD